MNAAGRLRTAAEHLPPGLMVTIPREALLEALEDRPARSDLTIRELAEHFKRSPSAVRNWLQVGLLRGYRLRGREWRVPLSAISEFEANQRNGGRRPTRDGDADLSSWRRIGSGE
jgi:excisionase family DNA binding protein